MQPKPRLVPKNKHEDLEQLFHPTLCWKCDAVKNVLVVEQVLSRLRVVAS